MNKDKYPIHLPRLFYLSKYISRCFTRSRIADIIYGYFEHLPCALTSGFMLTLKYKFSGLSNVDS